MNKIIASVGMFAFGTAGLQAANYGDIQPDQASKRWSVSAAVRGFYDDNYTTRPAGQGKEGSAGFEVSPSVSLNMPLETTFLGLNYVYTMSYFDDRSDNKVDQSHDVKLTFDHRFSERHHMSFTDQFVSSVEPTLIDQGGTITLRSKADGIHNRAVVSFDTQLTPLWSLSTGSENNYYNYADNGDGSYSALLDRDEMLFHIDPRYIVSPKTVAFLGYQYGNVNYLSSDLIAVGSTEKGTDRDNYSHYIYVGAEQKFSSVLSAEGRVGAQFITYNKLNQDTTSPYLDVLGTYNYLQGSYLKLGVKYAHNATDVGASTADPDDVTLDQETLTCYLSVSHRITALLSAGLLVQYQYSTYNGGEFDGDVDNYTTTALNLSYKLNRTWSVEASYYFDNLSSGLPGGGRDFSRNREFIGIRGTY